MLSAPKTFCIAAPKVMVGIEATLDVVLPPIAECAAPLPKIVTRLALSSGRAAFSLRSRTVPSSA